MPLHSSDSFSLSKDQQGHVLVHRRDVTDATKPPLTFELNKFETTILIETLCDDAEYRDIIIKYLEAHNFARPNHSIH